MKEDKVIEDLKNKVVDICGEELGNQIIKLAYQLSKIDTLEKEVEALKNDIKKED